GYPDDRDRFHVSPPGRDSRPGLRWWDIPTLTSRRARLRAIPPARRPGPPPRTSPGRRRPTAGADRADRDRAPAAPQAWRPATREFLRRCEAAFLRRCLLRRRLRPGRSAAHGLENPGS